MTHPKSETKVAAKPAKAKRAFNLVGLSLTGQDHLSGDSQGLGNQDCLGYRNVPRGIIAVVADGCGSESDSKTGSSAYVRITLNACEDLLSGNDQLPTPEKFCELLETRLLSHVRAAAEPLAKSKEQLTQVLYSSYLCTIWISVVTPDWTAIFGCGDGFYALGDELKEVKPKPGNAPEYLTYKLVDPVPEGFEDVGLRVAAKIDTEMLRSFMIATDGVEPVSRRTGERLRLHDLWRDRKYREQSFVRESFGELADSKVRLHVRQKSDNRAEVSAVQKRGLFSDDTTFVVLTRDLAVALPEGWKAYRDMYCKPAFGPQLPDAAKVPVPVGAVAQKPTEGLGSLVADALNAPSPEEIDMISKQGEEQKTEESYWRSFFSFVFAPVVWIWNGTFGRLFKKKDEDNRDEVQPVSTDPDAKETKHDDSSKK